MFLKITLLKYISYKKKQNITNVLKIYLIANICTTAKLLHLAICKNGVRENQLHITIDFVNIFSAQNNEVQVALIPKR